MGRQSRILVTGGAGYIGSHTVLELCGRFQVTVIDNLNRGHRSLVPPGVEFQQLDLRDRSGPTTWFRRQSFDAVMHFAALAYVGESMTDPGPYFENNLVGTQNLLDAMRGPVSPVLVFSSTCAVYGIPLTLPITEEAPCAPINPYGESKLATERMLEWYSRAYGFRWLSLRYFNAAGADPAGRSGEWHDPEPHLVPRLLDAARNQTPFQLHGSDYPTPDGSCVRDYIHVSDLAQAHVQALEYLFRGGRERVLNLGCGRGVSVWEMIAATERVMAEPIQVVTAPRRPGDPAELVAQPSRAMQELGWRPTRSDPDILLRTACDWFLAMPVAFRAASAGG